MVLIVLVSIVCVYACRKRGYSGKPSTEDGMPPEVSFPYPEKYELAHTAQSPQQTAKSTEKLVFVDNP